MLVAVTDGVTAGVDVGVKVLVAVTDGVTAGVDVGVIVWVLVGVGVFVGHVPQIGFGNTQAVAPVEKLVGVNVISVTHQELRSWLNVDAFWNIFCIVETLLTFQLPIFWLNAYVLRKHLFIVVTLLTSQLPMFWLKFIAYSNIDSILVTLLVFQLLILDELPLLNDI